MKNITNRPGKVSITQMQSNLPIRGVRSHSGCDDCYKYDYSGLRAVVTQENILVTVFRIAGEDLFVKKDSRHARALYRRRKSALRERDFLKEMRQAV